MDPETLLARLCDRHGVAPAQGARLLPLVRWALKGPETSRDRILAVVERALSGEGGSAEECKAELDLAADHAVLVAVARVLHGWSPNDQLMGLDFGVAGASEDPEGGAEPH